VAIDARARVRATSTGMIDAHGRSTGRDAALRVARRFESSPDLHEVFFGASTTYISSPAKILTMVARAATEARARGRADVRARRLL